MPGCVLRVSVPESVDVANVVAEFPLEPDVIYRKGEPRWSTSTQLRSYSGFNVTVSEQDGARAQIAESELFLAEYRDALKHLRTVVGAELALDFGTILPHHLFTRSTTLPPSLLSTCGELGIAIEVTVYRGDDGSEEPN